MKRLTALLLLAVTTLIGCTYTSVEYGEAKLTSFRLWTDTSVAIETPNARAGYSSDADGAQAAAISDRLLDAIIGPRLEARE